MKINKLITVLIIAGCVLNIQVKAQRFLIKEIIGDVYSEYRPQLDTINYILDELYPFFDTANVLKKDRAISLQCFRSEQSFITSLNNRESYFLKIRVVKISSGLLVLNLSLNRTNLKLYTNNPTMKVLEYINEREIECILQGTEWRFSRILRNKSHATNYWDNN